MNSYNNLRDVPLCWGDIVAMHEEREKMKERTFERMINALPKINIDRSPPFYYQSGSPIIDELRGIRSMGNCYFHQSFQIKICI